MFSPTVIPKLLAVAWLLPLLGFVVEIFAGRWQRDRKDRTAAALAVGCIATGFVCSFLALLTWGSHTGWAALAPSHHGDEHHAAAGHDGGQDEHAKHDHHDPADHEHANGDEKNAEPKEAHEIVGPLTGTFYTLARFGSLRLSVDYYIDSLTLVMFTMVTFIATCIHLFATGYMSEELTDDYVDHQVHTRNGGHFHRPGRFYRFFAFLSLFCFSMLGLVIAGNIFMVFVFWELVGVCSYFLIGFYVERKSASTAANKAFIMNRVGDFGFLIGLMVLWTSFGTFSFGPYNPAATGYEIASGLQTEPTAESGETPAPKLAPGLFGMARGADGELRTDVDVDGAATVVFTHADDTDLLDADGNHRTMPYVLLIIAGLGIFAGCVGKSAQFPLQTWLPDAMEGPTPVSALVHSATMVAAGVYLAARFYPMFTHEVLLTIAYIGCITAFVAATIAIVATDIKKVLAYSTISQLGYMMLGIGVGGWGAGLFHLITHAFFKSLMFLASGSVIYGCHHEQEMPKMGGLWRKMPITAFTMLAGVIAIAGLAIPGTPIAFSGFHSKDAIVANALAFTYANPSHFLLFVVPLVTAGITAFYMFRLWFYTFAGKPRDHHVYDHCHESPRIMTAPLVVLAVLAAGCAIGGEEGPLYKLITFSQPAGVDAKDYPIDADKTKDPPTLAPEPAKFAQTILPGHEAVHAVHSQAGMYALIAAFLGTAVAWLVYGKGVLDPADVKRQLSSLHTFLVEKWRFDTLYDVMFVRPVHVVASWCTAFDRVVIDGFLHFLARLTVKVAQVDRKFDEAVVDGFVNQLADSTMSVGRSFRVLQTGRLRQYVMFIAVSVVFLFVLVFAFFPRSSPTNAPAADVKVSARADGGH